MGVVKWFKQISGIEEIEEDQELDLNEERENEIRSEQNEIEKENKKNWKINDEKNNFESEKRKTEESRINKDEKIDKNLEVLGVEIRDNEQEKAENCQTIFIDPKSFGDCKKIANYIKEDRMVTLNLEYLDLETAQRMLDFLMGAMLIKEASFIEISKKVYTSVPKSIKVHYDGKKTINNRTYMDIRED